MNIAQFHELIWDAGSLFSKQSRWTLHTLKLKDFALVLFPCFWSIGLIEKQICPLVNSSNDTKSRLSKIILWSVGRLY